MCQFFVRNTSQGGVFSGYSGRSFGFATEETKKARIDCWKPTCKYSRTNPDNPFHEKDVGLKMPDKHKSDGKNDKSNKTIAGKENGTLGRTRGGTKKGKERQIQEEDDEVTKMVKELGLMDVVEFGEAALN